MQNRYAVVGKTAEAAVTDRRVGCTGNDLDLTPALFEKLADPARGWISGLAWLFAP